MDSLWLSNTNDPASYELHSVVVSPAFINDIVDGDAVEGVISPDDARNEWAEVLRTKQLSSKPERLYISGKGNWLMRLSRCGNFSHFRNLVLAKSAPIAHNCYCETPMVGF
jgi:hypothetical protein